jgi:hypothetical protein
VIPGVPHDPPKAAIRDCSGPTKPTQFLRSTCTGRVVTEICTGSAVSWSLGLMEADDLFWGRDHSLEVEYFGIPRTYHQPAVGLDLIP